MKKWEDKPYEERTSEDGYREAQRRIAEAREAGAGAGAEELDLSYLKLKSIPPELAELKGLTTLNINDNQLTDVVPVAELKALTKLHLGDNDLTNVTPLTDLKGLTRLFLANNGLTNIAPLMDLKALTKLWLGDNQLDNINPLAGLTKLKILALYRNQLTDITPLGNLTELTHLGLNENQLKDVFPLVGLTKLTELSLSDNPITNLLPLADLLRKLPDLHFKYSFYSGGIHLQNCPITDPPLEVARRGSAAVLRHWETKKRRGTIPNRTGRILLLGNGDAGKTSLADKLANDKTTIGPGQRSQTEDINIKPDVPFWVSKERYLARIWDLGGQVEKHVLHQYFFGSKSLYVVVVDHRRDTESFGEWLRMIDLLGRRETLEKTPVIIVYNIRGEKLGAACQPFGLPELERRYPNLELIGRCVNLGRTEEGENDPNWPEVRELIAEQLAALPLMTEILAPYVQLIEHVNKAMDAGQPHLPLTEFQATAQSENIGLISTEEANDAAKFLHAVGEVVFYEDGSIKVKSTIRDYVFTDPRWIVGAVYKILTLADLEQNNGRFSRRQLHQVWQSEGYAEQHWSLLEQLLLEDAFEVCYLIEDEQFDFLSPGSLPDQARSIDFGRPEGSHIYFRLQYEDYVPAGLMTRFIVRRHRMLADQNFYRYGAIIRKDIQTKESSDPVWLYAKVNAPELRSGAKNIVEIIIDQRGPAATAFLTELRAEFEDIHNTFYGRVRPEEVITCPCEVCQSLPGDKATSWPYATIVNLLEMKESSVPCTQSRKRQDLLELLSGIYLPQDSHLQQILQRLGYVHRDVQGIKTTVEDTNTRVIKLQDSLAAIQKEVAVIPEQQLFANSEEKQKVMDGLQAVVEKLPEEQQPDTEWHDADTKAKIKIGIDALKVLNKLTGVELDIDGFSLKWEREFELKKINSWPGFKQLFWAE